MCERGLAGVMTRRDADESSRDVGMRRARGLGDLAQSRVAWRWRGMARHVHAWLGADLQVRRVERAVRLLVAHQLRPHRVERRPRRV